METKTKFNMWQTVFVIQLNETQHKKITVRRYDTEEVPAIKWNGRLLLYSGKTVIRTFAGECG